MERSSIRHLKKESRVSRDIRILAEVEKIWILYDMDDNGELDFDELSAYLRNRSCSDKELKHEELQKIFDEMDENGD